MLQLAIHALEFIVCTLVLTLCHRLYRLHQRSIIENQLGALHQLIDQVDSTHEKHQETNTAASNKGKLDCLNRSLCFADTQLKEVSENKEIAKIVESSWLNDVSSLYLIGAIDSIGKQADCNIKGRTELIQQVVEVNKLAPTTNTLAYLSNIASRALDDENVDIVRSGAAAAKQWLGTGSVSIDLSLNERLGWWHYEAITSRIERNLGLA